MRKYILFFLLLFMMHISVKAEDFSKIEILIDSCFNALENSDINHLSSPSNSDYYYIFYEDEKCILSKYVSASICLIYDYSNKMNLLININSIFCNDVIDAKYSIIRPNGSILYDIQKWQCGNLQYDTINQAEVSNLIESYYLWYNKLKKEGVGVLIKNNITPLSFSGYNIIKEIAYFERSQFTYENLFDIGKEILLDTSYMSYLICNQDLNFIYPKLDNNIIISDLILLSYINYLNPFTECVKGYRLKIRGLNKSSFDLLEELIDNKQSEREEIVLSLLRKNKIKVRSK